MPSPLSKGSDGNASLGFLSEFPEGKVQRGASVLRFWGPRVFRCGLSEPPKKAQKGPLIRENPDRGPGSKP